MNKSKLKSYAPAARREFIQAVTDRAHFYGLSENRSEIQPVEEKGDVAIIGGRAFPIKMAAQRKNLEQRIEREGFAQVMEAIAYTWFNRFLALRYMEIHGYLEHGFRVLSNPNGNTIPEILEQAAHVQLPGLVQKKVVELKLDGNKDAELYRMLLVAQCNDLNTAMPFLFERINDETELLLPDNLLHSDSLIRKLVTEIDEEDWQQVEIIGWLYQFYISEKKDQVIGKVVKPEDIPAATQLFTPNWIVKYMVQNSLGRMWLATYPNSSIKGKMEYYIEPAEQTDEVKSQLAAITPKELNPETITLIDPASGSGHILVEAYDLFKEIYLERGYRSRDIPRLILEKNLYGLDIDDRAAQMSGFALLMKARADDRRILKDNSPRLNVMAIQGSEGIDAMSLADALLEEKTYSFVDGPSGGDNAPAFGTPSLLKRGKGELISPPLGGGDEGEGDFFYHSNDRLSKNDIKDLLELFKQGKNFGSLIQIPEKIAGKLTALANLVESNIQASDIFTQKAANTLLPFVRQAMILAGQYDCSVMNPPYMGSGYFNSTLKKGLSIKYNTKRSDLYAIFLERAFELLRFNGIIAIVTRQDWLFTRSYAELRKLLCKEHTLATLLQLGAGAFEMLSGEVTQTAAYVLYNAHIAGNITSFRDCSAEKKNKEITFYSAPTYTKSFEDFPANLQYPILYYLSSAELKALSGNDSLSDHFLLREGIHTGDNARFIRLWWEVSHDNIKSDCLSVNDLDSSGKKWVPYNKGGTTNRWYWGTDFVICYDKSNREEMALLTGHVRPSQDLYFREGGTWSDVASKGFGVRYYPNGYLFDGAGPVVVAPNIFEALAIMNSKPFVVLAEDVMPNLHFKCGTLQLMPYASPAVNTSRPVQIAKQLVAFAQQKAAVFEEQNCFQRPSLLVMQDNMKTIANSFINAKERDEWNNDEILKLESENNFIYAKAFGLEGLDNWKATSAEVSIFYPDQIVDCQRLISYAIGCMMGRYRIDRPGLIYAHSGNVDFWKIYNGDPVGANLCVRPVFGQTHRSAPTFQPDDDGIIPVMDMDWFEDDAASRFEEFLEVAWPDPSPQPSPPRGEGALLEENLKFVADSLSPKAGETSRDTIRRYFSAQFYKDHLQTYKKRPIYWLFSSGKQRAFECLVYLHRYNEATLSRMRNEYVTPLQGKFSARAKYLSNEINAAPSTSARTKLQKQLDALKKKQIELVAFDDLLRHYADKRITLDLDDGVKINYGKFGNLLAEVKAVTGSESEKD